MKNTTILVNGLFTLRDLIGLFWQLGMLLSLGLYIVSGMSFFKVQENIASNSSLIVSAVSWMQFATPIISFSLASLFLVLSINSYSKKTHDLHYDVFK